MQQSPGGGQQHPTKEGEPPRSCGVWESEAGQWESKVRKLKTRRGRWLYCKSPNLELDITESLVLRPAGLAWMLPCCNTREMGDEMQTVCWEQLLDCANSQTMAGNGVGHHGTFLICYDKTQLQFLHA